MVDFARQRLNMVESQVRPSDVTDRRVMTAMLHVARERFVPAELAPVAYADRDLTVPLPATEASDTGTVSRAILAPRVFGKLIQNLEIGDNDVVLDVGCATGYSTAVLARIAQTVVGIEADAAFVAYASKALEAAGADNAVIVQAPLIDGYASESPYDAILINGLVGHIPDVLLDQLKDGGRLVAIEENGRFGAAVQWRRLRGAFDKRWLFDCSGPRLGAFDRKAEFVF
ncbi:MAG TPA: protein-L-isoaspartate O-methyltransferase [Hyphomicrobiaceae bacterium]|nr:protein-L-isoaspartate O-methyltransferase [Hyphomicrobiaceae bacterium]